MSALYEIDINCDMGEGLGNESELLPYVSSCNIACGGHAGNRNSMRHVASEAKKYGVKVGAHPSYPDPDNFGRLSMKLSEEALIDSIRNQISELTGVLEELGISLHHIKPHGALYNDIAANETLAETFLEAVKNFKYQVCLYLPYGSKSANLALKKGFKVRFEAFGDRTYNNDLSLVSRKQQNALIEAPKDVLEQILRMVKNKEVLSVQQKKVKIEANTFCIHGDTPSALQILMYLSQELPNHQIETKK